MDFTRREAMSYDFKLFPSAYKKYGIQRLRNYGLKIEYQDLSSTPQNTPKETLRSRLSTYMNPWQSWEKILVKEVEMEFDFYLHMWLRENDNSANTQYDWRLTE